MPENPTIYIIALAIIIGGIYAAGKDCKSKQSTRDTSKDVSGVALLAGMLIIAGVIGVGYFFAMFDVTVGTAAGRVNNIGLMSDRQNGIIISLAIGIVGVLLMLFGKRK